VNLALQVQCFEYYKIKCFSQFIKIYVCQGHVGIVMHT
jgi:hypothetical protein